jgi:hypothetical protein
MVEIKPDAYSDTVFSGKVIAIANLAQNKDAKSKIKIFPVKIAINNKSVSLLPGLTVSSKIKIKELNGVLYVPVEAIFKEQGNEFVYVKTNSGFKRKDIKIGAVNTDFVVVKDGLEENEELALTDPYLNKEEGKENNKSNSNGK